MTLLDLKGLTNSQLLIAVNPPLSLPPDITSAAPMMTVFQNRRKKNITAQMLSIGGDGDGGDR